MWDENNYQFQTNDSMVTPLKFGAAEFFHPIIYDECGYLFVFGVKLINVTCS